MAEHSTVCGAQLHFDRLDASYDDYRGGDRFPGRFVRGIQGTQNGYASNRRTIRQNRHRRMVLPLRETLRPALSLLRKKRKRLPESFDSGRRSR
jgi:hypothetical protein